MEQEKRGLGKDSFTKQCEHLMELQNKLSFD